MEMPMNFPTDFFFLVLGAASPFLGVLAALLVALLALRVVARAKAARMSRAEFQHTGIGASTWDAYQGPSSEAFGEHTR
jgi:hypothetical protein